MLPKDTPEWVSLSLNINVTQKLKSKLRNIHWCFSILPLLHFNTLEMVLLLLNCYRGTASKCIMKFRPTYYKMLMEITCCHFTSLHNPFFGVLCGSVNISLTEVPCFAFCFFETFLWGFFPPKKLNENDANTWQPSLSTNHSSVWFHRIYLFVTVIMLRNTMQTSLPFLYVRSFFLPFQIFHPQKNGDTDDDGDESRHMCR